MNTAFKEALQDGDFELLDGRWLNIRVTDLQLDFYVTAECSYEQPAQKQEARLRLSEPRPCDVVIQGNSRDFLALAARREDPDTLFFARRLLIEGDTELGLGLKNLLDSLELEQLPTALNWTIQRLDNLLQSRNI